MLIFFKELEHEEKSIKKCVTKNNMHEKDSHWSK